MLDGTMVNCETVRFDSIRTREMDFELQAWYGLSKNQYLKRPIGNAEEKLLLFLTLKRSMDQRARVYSCFQTLIGTVIVVMKEPPGVSCWNLFSKIVLSVMQILCYSKIPVALFIMISKTIN